MSTPQPGILAPVPTHARYLEFGARPDHDPHTVLADLASATLDESAVIGIGPGLVGALGRSIDGLGHFPA